MSAEALVAAPTRPSSGSAPARAYRPESEAECAEVMAREAARGGRLAFAGGRTEIELGGAPEALDAVVDTRGMARILDYAPSDMVIAAEAGVTVAQLQAAARAERQMLALDPPLPERATLGGVVATGGFGPRRTRYGGVRDLIIGVTLVRADGVAARGGGKVVKNVAGFDLPKLMCGSLGTLGLIASATFRLHPLPEASATVLFPGLARGPGRVAARARAPGAAGAGRRRGAARRCGLPAAACASRASATACASRQRGWSRSRGPRSCRARRWPTTPRSGRDTTRRARPGRCGPSCARCRRSCRRWMALVAPLMGALRGGSLVWYASLGIGFAGGEVADAGAASAALAAARAQLVAGGGSLVVERAPAEVRAVIDPWGPVPDAFSLMVELKRRFDPQGRLNPGRFVGGL